jgi:ligand-binding SRPBCC domain-containing protein
MPVHAGPDAATGPVAQYELRCSLRAPLPLEQVFRFFESPGNLALITPRWLRFEIRTPGSIQMQRGLNIDYTIRWLGLPMRWTSRITEYEPSRLFVDEQVRGPYRRWHHRHDFFPDGEGTIISDRVSYSLPLGVIGRVANALLVKRQLLAIFRFRQRSVAKLLEADCTTIEAPVIRRLP